jgi:hypothetical protein
MGRRTKILLFEEYCNINEGIHSDIKKYIKKNSQIFDKAFEQDFRFVKINPSPK